MPRAGPESVQGAGPFRQFCPGEEELRREGPVVLALGRSLGLGWEGGQALAKGSCSLPSTPGGPACPCVLTLPHLNLLLAHPFPPVPRGETPLRASTSEGRVKAKCRG